MRSLYGKDSKGNLRIWCVFTDGKDVVVRHGLLFGKIQEKRYTAEGKNQGKANETTPEQQAVLEAEAKYVKQLKSGYFADKDDALAFEEFTPMKAQNYKDYAHKVVYPCYMQKKYNGQRVMLDSNGDAWSKQGEKLQLPNHWDGIRELAVEVGGLDGEIYAGLESTGGLSLQRVISAFRKPNEDTSKLRYYVYDVPSNESQEVRAKKLHSLCGRNSSLVVAETILVGNSAQGNAFYQQCVDDGYEGVVYRNLDGEYEFGKRSYNLIKRKPRQTAEAVVYAIDEDRNGWGILSCKTFEGIEFKCQMKVDAGDRNYRLYENALELIGKVIEFEYEELSDAGVPTKPSGVGIRQVDKYGRPLL